MKVKITREAKRHIAIEDIPIVKQMIAEANEYYNEHELAEYAVSIAGLKEEFQLLKFEAEIAKNCRADDSYFEGSKKYDIWVNIYAFNSYYGFYWIGAYISDLFKWNGRNADELKEHMFIRKYTK